MRRKRHSAWAVAARRASSFAKPRIALGKHYVALRTGISVESSATGSADRVTKSSPGANRSPSRLEPLDTTFTAARPASLCSLHNCRPWPAATNSSAPHQRRCAARCASLPTSNGQDTFLRSPSFAGTWASLMPHGESHCLRGRPHSRRRLTLSSNASSPRAKQSRAAWI